MVNGIGLALVGIVGLWLLVNFIKAPQEFVNVALDGLTRGSIYGVVALGYTLVYGILQLINFAHGDVFSLSGLVASTVLLSVLGLTGESSNLAVIGGIIVTLAITIPLFALVNATIERIAYRPLRNAPRLTPLITAVGMSFIVSNISLALYGVDYESGSDLIPQGAAFEIGDIRITWKLIFALAIITPALIALSWFVGYTRQGKAMRAVSQDTEASAMMGINVNRTISVTFVIARRTRGRRRPRLPARVQHPLRHRLRARPDRVHRGGARRDRQPRGRRRRRPRDRVRPVVQRGPHLVRAGG